MTFHSPVDFEGFHVQELITLNFLSHPDSLKPSSVCISRLVFEFSDEA